MQKSNAYALRQGVKRARRRKMQRDNQKLMHKMGGRDTTDWMIHRMNVREKVITRENRAMIQKLVS